jgi:protein TonB
MPLECPPFDDARPWLDAAPPADVAPVEVNESPTLLPVADRPGYRFGRQATLAMIASVAMHGGALWAAWHYLAPDRLHWRLKLQRGDNRVALQASIAAHAADAEPWESIIETPLPPTVLRKAERPKPTEKSAPTTLTRMLDESVAVRPQSDDKPAKPEPERRATSEAAEPERRPEIAELMAVVDEQLRPPPRSRKSAELTPQQTSAEFTSPASEASTAAAGADVPEAPARVRYVESQYPPESQAAGEQGTVEVWVRVDAEGVVVDAGVLQSSGFPRLDSAAVTAVRLWGYAAAGASGRATAREFRESVHFRLERRTRR